MFRTTTNIGGKKKAVSVRFSREDDSRTMCELKIGGVNTSPQKMKTCYTGTSIRNKIDTFDKAKGHIVSLSKALSQSGMDRKSRRDVFAAYSEWARKNHLRTNVSLGTVGI